eukprot:ANDGO_06622.mRNA.1 Cyclic AMP receptor-like protein A
MSNDEPFTQSENDALAVIGMIFAVFSIAGCLFMIISYRRFKKIHHRSMQYVEILALANLLSYAPSFFGPQTDTSSAVCQSQAFLFLVFQLASIFWTIAVSLTMLIIIYKPFTDVADYSRAWHVLCWGAPLILSISALGTRKLGEDTGAFCFIPDPLDQFVFFYLWLWLSFILFAVVAVLSKKRLNHLSKTELSLTAQKNLLERGHRAFKRLGGYPVVLFLVWFFPSIVRLYEFANPNSYLFWMHVIFVMFTRMQGIVNAFLYGANKKLMAEVRKTPLFGLLLFYLCVLQRHDKTSVIGNAPRIVHTQFQDEDDEEARSRRSAVPSAGTGEGDTELQQI